MRAWRAFEGEGALRWPDRAPANAVGGRTPIRAATCIHLRPDSRINLCSDFQCVSMGDSVGVAPLGLPGERCRIGKVSAFVAGSP